MSVYHLTYQSFKYITVKGITATATSTTTLATTTTIDD